MKKRRCRRYFAGLLFTTFFVAMTSVTAFAAGTISSLSLTVRSDEENTEVEIPEVETSASGVSIENVSFRQKEKDWKPGARLTLEVELQALPGYQFADSYDSKKIRVYGADFSGASTEDGKLTVRAAYYPRITLGMPEDPGFGDPDFWVAKWKKVKHAGKYQVRLYYENDLITVQETTGTKLDLGQYMTREGDYYYEIRAMAESNGKAKSARSSDYAISEVKVLSDLGDTTGRWWNYGWGTKFRKADGTFATGWYRITGRWYYFDPEGKMVTGWIHPSEKWYFMKDDGTMQTEWFQKDGIWYYFNPDGAMATGWVKDGPDLWYYMNPSATQGVEGALMTGWVNDRGTWYYLNGDGIMATGWLKLGETWYFLNADGSMATGWIQGGPGQWYYLNPDGSMAVSTTIGDYRIGPDGVMEN